VYGPGTALATPPPRVPEARAAATTAVELPRKRRLLIECDMYPSLMRERRAETRGFRYVTLEGQGLSPPCQRM